MTQYSNVSQAAPVTPKNRVDGFARWLAVRRGSLIGWALTVAIVLLLLWPHVLVAVPPGHTGVLFKRFFGGTVMDTLYREGTHIVFPWDTLHIFDTRLHEEVISYTVLTKRGLLIDLDISVIYHPRADKTPVLLTSVGKDYREKLIIPTLAAAVRGTASEYDKEDFYTEMSRTIQDKMQVTMMQALGRNPVIVDNLFIRGVRLPESLNLAVNEKFVAEQQVQRQAYKVQEATERYKATYVDAQAVKMMQELVNPGMNDNFLRWQGIEATRDLAQSANSKIVVVGGKDGLPLILNTEARSEDSSAPAGVAGKNIPSASASAGNAGKIPSPSALPAPPLESAELPFMERIGLESLHQELLKLERQFGGGLLQPQPDAPAAYNPKSESPGAALKLSRPGVMPPGK